MPQYALRGSVHRRLIKCIPSPAAPHVGHVRPVSYPLPKLAVGEVTSLSQPIAVFKNMAIRFKSGGRDAIGRAPSVVRPGGLGSVVVVQCLFPSELIGLVRAKWVGCLHRAKSTRAIIGRRVFGHYHCNYCRADHAGSAPHTRFKRCAVHTPLHGFVGEISKGISHEIVLDRSQATGDLIAPEICHHDVVGKSRANNWDRIVVSERVQFAATGGVRRVGQLKPNGLHGA